MRFAPPVISCIEGILGTAWAFIRIVLLGFFHIGYGQRLARNCSTF